MNAKRLCLLALAVMLFAGQAKADEQTLRFGNFGTVTIYRHATQPAHVVLFVSGDGGWNLGVVDMARQLAALDALVVGIDVTHYFRKIEGSPEACSYPAADFEALSKFVQKKFGYPRYVLPVLVGYSSGATLVYATIVQSPPNTFRAAISLGFCPDVSLKKLLCKGNGLTWRTEGKGKGYCLLPDPNLETPWIVLQGSLDRVCNPEEAQVFVSKVPMGEFVKLPHVGHGFSVPRNWMPPFKEAFLRLTKKGEIPSHQTVGGKVEDLPLVEVAASGQTGGKPLAVMLSGDGGWAGLDREVANALAAQGVPVVGLNCLQYFWTPRTPEGAAKDLERILLYYLARWNKEEAILAGYSLGADVLPFMANRLPANLLAKISLVALMGLGQKVEFEFHLGEWLHASPGKKALPVLPEVERLSGTKILCFYGQKEKDSLCRELSPELARGIRLPGGHHFGGDYEAIADSILGAWRADSNPQGLSLGRETEAR